jgi:branched-chain amino acid transport system ATP-binding protein
MSAASTRLLQVEDLCVSYGLGNVVTHVSFEMDAGQTLAVLGPNGAGKTSLGRAIAGLVKPATGAIRYESAPLTGTSVHEISRIGICYLPEVRGIFPSLSVRDNLRMFARGKPRTERNAGIERALELFPALARRERQRAGTLSGGEQQMLALTRVFMRTPGLLIVDEPSMGLAPSLVDMVFDMLGLIREEGVAIILMEQYVRRALAFADQCMMLQRGSVVWYGAASGAAGEVIQRYLGEV